MIATAAHRSFIVGLLLAITAGALGSPVGAAQRTDTACDADFATAVEPLDSAGLGLTRDELDDLYGPGEDAEMYRLYELDGYSLWLSDCNLDVKFDPDGPYTDTAAAQQLARDLLPRDAVLMGAWRFGSFMSTIVEVEEWISPELARRYRELGQTRTGSILVIYTYTHMGAGDDRVTLIQLGTGSIPREG